MRLALSLFFLVPYQLIVLVYVIFHSIRNSEFRETLLARILGGAKADHTKSNPIWIHSASVGEVRGLAPFVEMLLKRKPKLNLIFTTTSNTGLLECRKLYPDRFSSLLPLDFSFLISSFIKKNRPKLIIINETEIWPQLLIQAKKKNVPVSMVNGRISDRTFPRYLRLKPLFSFLLEKINQLGVQTALDQERFISIGANPSNVSILGNTKFDTLVPSETTEIHEILREFRTNSNFTISFGSIREEEEEIILEALSKILKEEKVYSILIAPRHPRRFKDFLDKLVNLGLPVVQRSNFQGTDIKNISGTKIFYLDTLGEMLNIYRESDLAFVGGTYSEVGGHNILEPAYFSIPIVVGPRIETQREAFEALSKTDGVKVVNDANELGNTLIELLNDKKALELQGQCAYNAYLGLRGASDKLYAKLEKYL